MLLAIPTLKSLLPSTMLVTEAELDPASVAARTISVESQGPVVLGQQYIQLNHNIKTMQDISMRELIDFLAARSDIIPGSTIVLENMATAGGDIDMGKVRVESKEKERLRCF